MSLPRLLPGDLPLARRRFDALRARGDAAALRYKTLSDEVGKAKARVDANESVQAVLVEMQRRGHARSVGVFEQLLTALLRDVFPEERTVHLDLYTERGLPALDLYIAKKEGELEDTETGTGGGVTNGLSTGLRFIALARSGRRPFIILDEPDCWMETKRVPAFARLIQQTATELGIQVLMISHHPDHLLSAIPYRLLLEKGPEALEIHWSPTSEIPQWQPDQEGLREVVFENCLGHTKTHMPLAPGVTLLRGSNDEGKSSLVATLAMVLEGKSKDSMIQHHKPWARVTMDFGPDKVVRFQRKRTGSPKVSYEHIDPALGETAKPLRRSTDARGRPDWLLDVTGIGDVDDLNVQMGSQKQPVFLLNHTPTQRAKALAIGSESGYIQQMLAFDKQEVQDARLFIRQGEKELERLHRMLQTLTPVMGADTLTGLEDLARAWPERRREEDQRRELVEQWAEARWQRHALMAITQQPAPVVPAASPAPQWRAAWAPWQAARRQRVALDRLSDHPPLRAPSPSPVPGWRELHVQWMRARVLARAAAKLATHPAHRLEPTAPQSPRWHQLAADWTRARRQLHALERLAQPLPPAPRPSQTSGRLLWRDWAMVRRQRERLLQGLQTEPPTRPTLSSTAQEWRRLRQEWLDSKARLAHEQALFQTACEEAERAAQEEADALTALRCAEPTCPVCHRPWTGAERD